MPPGAWRPRAFASTQEHRAHKSIKLCVVWRTPHDCKGSITTPYNRGRKELQGLRYREFPPPEKTNRSYWS
eukprot:1146047-Pelagomonas_calceolata.AAC.2